MPCFFYFELFLKREKRKGRGFLRERVLSSTSSTSRPPFLALLPRRANARSPPPRPSPPPFEQLDAGAQGLEDTALAAGRRGSKKEKQRTKKKKKAEGQGGGGGVEAAASPSPRDRCSINALFSSRSPLFPPQFQRAKVLLFARRIDTYVRITREQKGGWKRKAREQQRGGERSTPSSDRHQRGDDEKKKTNRLCLTL